MEIVSCRLFRYDLPLVAPIEIKRSPINTRSGLLIRLEDQHHNVGWGEIAPLAGMSHETLDQAQQQIVAMHGSIAGSTLADGLFALNNDRSLLLALDHCVPSVRWGVEQALWNLHASSFGVPLHYSLASQPHEKVAINGLLTGTPDDILEQAQRMREEGYRAIKLKVGRQPIEKEITLVHQVRAIIGDAIELRLDANRAWEWDAAMRFSEAIADCAIVYIEEPLVDPVLLPRFMRSSPVPVALDETLSEVSDDQVDRYNGVAAFVIKPSLLGGINAALQMAHTAERVGAVAIFSSLFETGLTIITLAQLAATLEHDAPSGLDTYRWLESDVLTPRLRMNRGSLDLTLVNDNLPQLRHLQEVRLS